MTNLDLLVTNMNLLDEVIINIKHSYQKLQTIEDTHPDVVLFKALMVEIIDNYEKGNTTLVEISKKIRRLTRLIDVIIEQ